MPPAAIKRIVAAKPVRCDVCGLTILVGDEYDRWVNQEHGKVISEAGHVVCRRIGECVAREWRDSSWNMGDGNVIDGYAIGCGRTSNDGSGGLPRCA